MVGEGFEKEVQSDTRFAENADSEQIHQIGNMNKRGGPVASERDAILDIMKSGKCHGHSILFHDKATGKSVLIARKGKIVLPEWGER